MKEIHFDTCMSEIEGPRRVNMQKKHVMDQLEFKEVKGHSDIYMGGPVEKVTMPNGAIVNKAMAEHYSNISDPKVTKLTENIHVLENFSLENTVVIEGHEGLIVWDTGSNMGIGNRKYLALRQWTDKPVKAIIYSHNHYTKGARAFVPNGDEGEKTLIVSHPDVHKNIMNSSVELGKVLSKTTAQHFGILLPQSGPDAPPVRYDGGSDADKTNGYIQPTYGVDHEEELTIDGVRMKFFHTPSDTFDSLTVWLPDHDTVITNSIWHIMPNLYTLRGQPYRDPVYWIEGIDQIRKINPKILIPSHGSPMKTRETSYELATVYRDFLSYIYCQTVRGINQGLKPEEVSDGIIFLEHFKRHPRLKEVYGEFKHQIKGIYSGIIGWFSLDAADINPVPISFRSQKIIEGYGGLEGILAACQESMDKQEYAWAAELVTHVLNIDPNHGTARQIKANSLKQMGYATAGLSSRGFYLSQALELEGRMDLNDIPNSFSKNYDEEVASHLPIENSIKLLEYKIAPEKALGMNRVVAIEFPDRNKCFGLHVRYGIAEFIDHQPMNPEVKISLPSDMWLQMILGKITPSMVVSGNNSKVTGNASDLVELLEVFEFIPKGRI